MTAFFSLIISWVSEKSSLFGHVFLRATPNQLKWKKKKEEEEEKEKYEKRLRNIRAKRPKGSTSEEGGG
jgi:hypothetical protein